MKKILVGVEASEDAGDVLEAAVEQTHRGEERPEMLVVYIQPLLDAREVFDPAGVEDSAERVSELEQNFPQLRGRIRLVAGEPVAAICSAASEASADLILLGPGGRRRRLRGRQESRIAKYAACPVQVIEQRRAG